MENKCGYNIKQLVIILTALLSLMGCGKTEENFKRTVIVYMSADNDLSDNALRNIEQMKSSFPVNEENNLIVFVNLPDEIPYILKIEADKEIKIKEYTEFNSLEVANMNKVLTEIIGKYPADKYGLVLWSHASSWLPVGFNARSFGEEKGLQMDILDMNKALPIKFDYILFDACLMGAVEVAYELKDKTDYIIASSTETIYTGFPYEMIISELMTETPDLCKIAGKYMDYYQQLSGIYQSATISVIHTTELSKLAGITRKLIEENLFNLDLLNRSAVQQLDNYENQYIFDFSDFIYNAFPNASKEQFDNQLQKAVLYKANTNEFMKEYVIKTYCGLSTYIPLKSNNELNNYYRKLKWCNDSGYQSFL
ncbi:clostripain-related cysteine peptidase [Bacteroides sp. 519]|uniref:clostripain-related cysteine peptidase n=1 Tax=Bacteroides sp. 519 TaxID=2302937 RepID=UPI0013D3C1B3|nr:clostripain-related cysteine peptidase [Bacteroides sp. 519]NDV60057.1 hypothetical protein [Bacteroides sp. 519]